MSKSADNELGMNREILRRDFLQGCVAAGTLGLLEPDQSAAAGPVRECQNAAGYYPPTRLGLRGDHPGSFEAAHALRDDDFWNGTHALVDTQESYDLVVVGGGISGLAAAHFYRSKKPKAKILIIENHDDFGGHAKRNEFHVNGRVELINGGTMDIDSPTPYSAVASGLLKSLGVEPKSFEKKYSDRSAFAGLKTGVFFAQETFGVDRLVAIDIDDNGIASPQAWKAFVRNAPISEAAKRSILKVETGRDDYYPGLTSDQKKDKLWRISYRDYLLEVLGIDPGAMPLYQHRTDEEWGVGIDAVSALDCWGMGYPGFAGLNLAPGGPSLKRMGYTPAGYSTTGGSEFFHFPDGNASIARLLVRKLIPNSMPGRDAVDIVNARCDYARLDAASNDVRLRLNSLVVRARTNGSEIDIAYTPSWGSGFVYKVRAKHCVLACWNMIIPWLVPELPDKQKAALRGLVKTPLVYTSVALRNWRPFRELGVKRVILPGGFYSSFNLNPSVNIDGYRSVGSPDDPVLIRMMRACARPGLSEYEQNREGRIELLRTPFEVFERHVREQLGRTLGTVGFDPARDIEGIVVNRWAHGYAPEYNSLWEKDCDAYHTPNLIARQRFGNITIANSDSGYGAFTDVAIDQAHRAVWELLND